jgi:hypothetical protein
LCFGNIYFMAIILAKGRARLSLGLPGPAPMVGWGGDGINAAQACVQHAGADASIHFIHCIRGGNHSGQLGVVTMIKQLV